MTVAEPKEAPEPAEPGSLATSPIDKLLVEFGSAVRPEGESHVDTLAGWVAADGITAARLHGVDVREFITALGQRLTEAAKLLGAAPFGEAEIDAFAAGLGPDAEEPKRPV